MLSNHFHVLLRVPPRPGTLPSDEEILDRCRALYAPGGMQAVEVEFEDAARMGETALARVRAKYLKRMWDLSEFMKTLKQKFTSWFNRQRARAGTLWESRFASVLVEGSHRCLLKVAAYIDLNPVRAGLAQDPKDYRWCGYAEAVSGDRAARAGLVLALEDERPGTTWRELGRRYREVLFGIQGDNDSGAGSSVPSPGEVARAISSGKKLTLVELLRCRVRYFSAGLAIGTESFIEAFFSSRRQNFGARRQSGARRLKGGGWGRLRCARDLAVEPLSPCGID